MFGIPEEQLSEFGVTFGIGAFILYMFFIVWDLARKSEAGRFGTFILFFVLAFGMIGFIAKTIMVKILGM